MTDAPKINDNRGAVSGKRPTMARDRFVGVLLLLLVLAAYASVFSAGFIWDDDDYVINNLQLRSLEGLYRIWFEPGATPQYYPLVFTLFWLQFKLWGLAPLGYHCVNILFHGANAFLLYHALKRLHIQAPFWIAAIFALHPVQVESVAWITELKNLLSTFFFLCSFLLFWQFRENPFSRRQSYLLYGLSLLAFMLALLSKSVTGSLPAVILLLCWWKYGALSPREVARLLPFFCLALLCGWNTARLEVTLVQAAGTEWDLSFMERVLIAGRAVWFYIGKLLWPQPLIFNYERWQIDATVWWQYLFPLGAFAVAGVLWQARHRIGRGALAGYLFFVGTLFPALGFINVYPMRYSFVADHFQYISGIGIIALLVTGIVRGIPRRICDGHAETVLFVPLLLLLAGLTWHQGKIYHGRLALFTDTIEKNPRSWLSYSNRGRDYALAGREDLALIDLDKSLEINPRDADSLQVRGAIALKNGDFVQALADMDRSLALYPLRVDYLRNRSLANRNAGKMAAALADIDRAIDLAPEDPQGYLQRASLQAMMEQYSFAERDLAVLIQLGYPVSAEERSRIMSLNKNWRNR